MTPGNYDFVDSHLTFHLAITCDAPTLSNHLLLNIIQGNLKFTLQLLCNPTLLNFTLDVFTSSIRLLLNFIQGKLSFTLDSITLIHSSIEYIHTCGLQQLASEF